MAAEEWELYRDRYDAGRHLADQLQQYAHQPGVVVLALPRGGVPVGFEVAERLGLPFDLFLVRKLGSPGRRELAMGAIASGGIRVLNDEVVAWLGITPAEIESAATEEQRELERRETAYREGRPPLELEGRVVILVDDGLATGSTMRAAVLAVRERRASHVIVAVPVGAPDTCRVLGAVADEVVCPRMPAAFAAVGQWYLDFDQTSDDEVRGLLGRRGA